jgi:putative toxin-antitoxin system antitoxin component (TIGR02293 family)
MKSGKGKRRAAGRSLTAGGKPAVITAISSEDIPTVPAMRAKPKALSSLRRHGYSEQELAALVVPRRTLARRRSGDELLTVEETDKAIRLKRVAVLAEKVFGDPDKARSWLREPKRALQGETPLAFLASETSARLIEDMLHRIDQGIFA